MAKKINSNTYKPVATAIENAQASAPIPATEQRSKSTLAAPVAIVKAFCARVHDDLVSGRITRAEVLARLIAAGINPHTAQTQYAKYAREHGITSGRGTLTSEQITSIVSEI